MNSHWPTFNLITHKPFSVIKYDIKNDLSTKIVVKNKVKETQIEINIQINDTWHNMTGRQHEHVQIVSCMLEGKPLMWQI